MRNRRVCWLSILLILVAQGLILNTPCDAVDCKIYIDNAIKNLDSKPTEKKYVMDPALVDLSMAGLNRAQIVDKINNSPQSKVVAISRENLSYPSVESVLVKKYPLIFLSGQRGSNGIMDYMNFNVKSQKTFIIFPNDQEGLRNTFSQLKNASEEDLKPWLSEAQKANNRHSSLKNTIMYSDSEKRDVSQAEMFLKEIQQDRESNLEIIITHNDNGQICFPDGSRLNINTIPKVIKKDEKRVLIISCSTSSSVRDVFIGPVTTRPMAFESIIDAVKIIQDETVSGERKLLDICSSFNSNYHERVNPYRTGVKVVFATAGVSYVVYVGIIKTASNSQRSDDEKR